MQKLSCEADSVQSQTFSVTINSFLLFAATWIFTLEGIPLLMHTSDFQHNLWLHVFPFSQHCVCGAAFVEAFWVNPQWNKSFNKTNTQLDIQYGLKSWTIKDIVVCMLENAQKTHFRVGNITVSAMIINLSNSYSVWSLSQYFSVSVFKETLYCPFLLKTSLKGCHLVTQSCAHLCVFNSFVQL